MDDPAACANCHIMREHYSGWSKSSHRVRSPLLNLNRACQTYHNWPEAELRARAETIQERHFRLRSLALDALVALIHDIRTARAAGATDAELATARGFQRKAQFYVDFIEAENSMGFHAPQESARILAESINFSRQGQVALRGLGRAGH
jgi:nitrite reductase (cytochrome c-552)